MSAPRTNTRIQTRRHWPMLSAIFLAAVVGVLLAIFGSDATGWMSPEDGSDDVSAEDYRTGDVEVPPEAPVREIDPVGTERTTDQGG